jgi:hypothetical protein
MCVTRHFRRTLFRHNRGQPWEADRERSRLRLQEIKEQLKKMTEWKKTILF